METGKNQGKGGNLKYQCRFISGEWFDIDFKGWIDLLRLNLFDHEVIADALISKMGVVKTTSTRQFRVMK